MEYVSIIDHTQTFERKSEDTSRFFGFNACNRDLTLNVGDALSGTSFEFDIAIRKEASKPIDINLRIVESPALPRRTFKLGRSIGEELAIELLREKR